MLRRPSRRTLSASAGTAAAATPASPSTSGVGHSATGWPPCCSSCALSGPDCTDSASASLAGSPSPASKVGLPAASNAAPACQRQDAVVPRRGEADGLRGEIGVDGHRAELRVKDVARDGQLREEAVQRIEQRRAAAGRGERRADVGPGIVQQVREPVGQQRPVGLGDPGRLEQRDERAGRAGRHRRAEAGSRGRLSTAPAPRAACGSCSSWPLAFASGGRRGATIRRPGPSPPARTISAVDCRRRADRLRACALSRRSSSGSAPPAGVVPGPPISQASVSATVEFERDARGLRSTAASLPRRSTEHEHQRAVDVVAVAARRGVAARMARVRRRGRLSAPSRPRWPAPGRARRARPRTPRSSRGRPRPATARRTPPRRVSPARTASRGAALRVR